MEKKKPVNSAMRFSIQKFNKLKLNTSDLKKIKGGIIIVSDMTEI